MHTIGSTSMWVAFCVVITLALAVDFLVLRAEGPHKVSFRQAAWWSLAWIALALLFNLALWFWLDYSAGRAVAHDVSMQFLTGYVVEKSLAIDNIFVFLLIFNYFAVPAVQQQRALMLGVLGALILRAIMIFIGAALIARFHWILYVFGVFLVFTGAKMLGGAGVEVDFNANPMLRFMRTHLRLTDGFRGSALRVREDGITRFTPMFLVLIVIAVSDVIFAVDSIPAVFAITTDPFIVLTSNVFAVLGLRALFFMLAGMAERFHLLNYGLAGVLIFIGVKMLIVHWWEMPIAVALGVVALLIGGSLIASLLIEPAEEKSPVEVNKPD